MPSVFLDRSYCDIQIAPVFFQQLDAIKSDPGFFNTRQQKYNLHHSDLPEGDKFFSFLGGKQVSLPDARSINCFQKCCYFFQLGNLASLVEGKSSASINLDDYRKVFSEANQFKAPPEVFRRPEAKNLPILTSSPRTAAKAPVITSPFQRGNFNQGTIKRKIYRLEV